MKSLKGHAIKALIAVFAINAFGLAAMAQERVTGIVGVESANTDEAGAGAQSKKPAPTKVPPKPGTQIKPQNDVVIFSCEDWKDKPTEFKCSNGKNYISGLTVCRFGQGEKKILRSREDHVFCSDKYEQDAFACAQASLRIDSGVDKDAIKCAKEYKVSVAKNESKKQLGEDGKRNTASVGMDE